MIAHQSPTESNILDAPEEVKKALSKLYGSLDRFRKARRQVEAWHRELEYAAKEVDLAQSNYEEVAGRWDLVKNTIKPDEKLEISL